MTENTNPNTQTNMQTNIQTNMQTNIQRNIRSDMRTKLITSATRKVAIGKIGNHRNLWKTKPLTLAAGSYFLSVLFMGCHPVAGAPTDSLKGYRAGIINGEEVDDGQTFSRQVVALVRSGSEGQALCTATLISDSVALTAAHCLDDSPDELELAFTPQLSEASSSDIRMVDKFIQNPGWKSANGNSLQASGRSDLGVVHFQGGIPENYSPMRLDHADGADIGSAVIVAGYGISDASTKQGAGILRMAQTGIIQELNSTEVLMGGQSGGVCFGDSGGPAVMNGKLYAVSSAVTSELCDENSVHTRVAPYVPWINAAAQKLDSATP